MTGQYPFPVIDLPEGLPLALRERGFGGRKGSGQWEWLRKLIVNEMGPAARRGRPSTKCITMPNKKDAGRAQCAAQGVSYKKSQNRERGYVVTHFTDPRYTILTRTFPVDGKDGAYFLYIQVEFH